MVVNKFLVNKDNNSAGSPIIELNKKQAGELASWFVIRWEAGVTTVNINELELNFRLQLGLDRRLLAEEVNNLVEQLNSSNGQIKLSQDKSNKAGAQSWKIKRLNFSSSPMNKDKKIEAREMSAQGLSAGVAGGVSPVIPLSGAEDRNYPIAPNTNKSNKDGKDKKVSFDRNNNLADIENASFIYTNGLIVRMLEAIERYFGRGPPYKVIRFILSKI